MYIYIYTLYIYACVWVYYVLHSQRPKFEICSKNIVFRELFLIDCVWPVETNSAVVQINQAFGSRQSLGQLYRDKLFVDCLMSELLFRFPDKTCWNLLKPAGTCRQLQRLQEVLVGLCPSGVSSPLSLPVASIKGCNFPSSARWVTDALIGCVSLAPAAKRLLTSITHRLADTTFDSCRAHYKSGVEFFFFFLLQFSGRNTGWHSIAVRKLHCYWEEARKNPCRHRENLQLHQERFQGRNRTLHLPAVSVCSVFWTEWLHQESFALFTHMSWKNLLVVKKKSLTHSF